jgi:putative component of membrane protein insertase Oxa1/YidC/SpoIIIJ protein YidD
MNKRLLFIIIGLLSSIFVLKAQSDTLDLELISATDFSTNTIVTYYHNPDINTTQILQDTTDNFRPVSKLLYGILYLYQTLISEQISASCLYEISCSNFGKYAILEFGAIKGAFLALDRITRCSGLAIDEIPEYRFNSRTHKFDDKPVYYKLKAD